MSSYYSEPALSLDAAAPGSALPPLTKRPSPVDVVLFAAAIRNYHRLHYDQAYTSEQGIDDVIVPGFMLGNWCVEAASRAFGVPVTIRRLTFKNVAVAYVDRTFVVAGEVQSVDGVDGSHRVVRCRFQIRDDDDRLVTTGEVEVACAEA